MAAGSERPNLQTGTASRSTKKVRRHHRDVQVNSTENQQATSEKTTAHNPNATHKAVERFAYLRSNTAETGIIRMNNPTVRGRMRPPRMLSPKAQLLRKLPARDLHSGVISDDKRSRSGRAGEARPARHRMAPRPLPASRLLGGVIVS